jgi:DNA invertase Pin-like site-specific DNA recombinase
MINKKLTDADKKQIQELRQQGKTYKEVMKALNISKKSIYKYSNIRGNKKLPEDIVQKIHEMIDQDLKYDYIAMKLGICRMSVVRYSHKKKKNRKWNTKDLIKIAGLHKSGLSWREIGEAYNCRGESIRQLVFLYKNKMNLEV